MVYLCSSLKTFQVKLESEESDGCSQDVLQSNLKALISGSKCWAILMLLDADDFGGCAGGLPRCCREFLDTIVSNRDAMDGISDGSCQGYKKAEDCSMGWVMKTGTTKVDRVVGKEEEV
jgi:hypothetical protein